MLSPVPEGWKHLPSTAKSLIPTRPSIPTPIIEQFSRLRIAQAFDIFARSMDITSLMLGELRLQMDKPDAIIRPDVHEYSMLDEVRPEILIERGQQAAAEQLVAIQNALSWQKKARRRIRRVPPPGMILNPHISSGSQEDSNHEPA